MSMSRGTGSVLSKIKQASRERPSDVHDAASNHLSRSMAIVPPARARSFVWQLKAVHTWLTDGGRTTNEFKYVKALAHEFLAGYRAGGGSPMAAMVCFSFTDSEGGVERQLSAVIVTEDPDGLADHVRGLATATSVMES